MISDEWSTIVGVVIAAMGFFLTALREVADAFQVADDASHVVHVLAMAVGTFFEVPLVDVAAVVADGVGDVEGKVVAAFCGGYAQQLAVLLFGKVLVEVEVQGATAGEVLDIRGSVQLELVEDGQRVVLDHVEVAVVAVARHEVAVLAVPFGVFYPHVLGGNHLAVEK